MRDGQESSRRKTSVRECALDDLIPTLIPTSGSAREVGRALAQPSRIRIRFRLDFPGRKSDPEVCRTHP